MQGFKVRAGGGKVEAKPLIYSAEKCDNKGMKEIGYQPEFWQGQAKEVFPKKQGILFEEETITHTEEKGSTCKSKKYQK